MWFPPFKDRVIRKSGIAENIRQPGKLSAHVLRIMGIRTDGEDLAAELAIAGKNGLRGVWVPEPI